MCEQMYLVQHLVTSVGTVTSTLMSWPHDKAAEHGEGLGRGGAGRWALGGEGR